MYRVLCLDLFILFILFILFTLFTAIQVGIYLVY